MKLMYTKLMLGHPLRSCFDLIYLDVTSRVHKKQEQQQNNCHAPVAQDVLELEILYMPDISLPPNIVGFLQQLNRTSLTTGVAIQRTTGSKTCRSFDVQALPLWVWYDRWLRRLQQLQRLFWPNISNIPLNIIRVIFWTNTLTLKIDLCSETSWLVSTIAMGEECNIFGSEEGANKLFWTWQ